MKLYDNSGCPELDAARIISVARRVGAGVSRVTIHDRTFSPHELPTSYVYLVGFDNYVKIGTATDVDKRISTIQTSVPVLLRIYGVIPHAGREKESALHYRFRNDRLGGEWFWLSAELKAFIRKISIPAIIDGPPVPRRLAELQVEPNA